MHNDREILPPRARTETIDCLRVCLNNQHRIATIELVQAGSELSCVSHQVIVPDVIASKLWDFGSRLFVNQETPRKLHHKPTDPTDAQWEKIPITMSVQDLIKVDSSEVLSIEQKTDSVS